MVTVTVSSRYQIVIPVAIRETVNIEVGQKIQLFPYQNRIELVPLRKTREMRGFLNATDTGIKREGDRE